MHLILGLNCVCIFTGAGIFDDYNSTLNDADLYTGCAVRVEKGPWAAGAWASFPVRFQEKVSQQGELVRWRGPWRFDFTNDMTVGELRAALVEYANDLEQHAWMAEVDPQGVALRDLPEAEQPAFREGFRWYLHECRLRVGAAVLTTNIDVDPQRALSDDSETVGAAGLTENMALYLERGSAPQTGQLLLTLYRQISELPPQPLVCSSQFLIVPLFFSSFALKFRNCREIRRPMVSV